jgi:hypothetical protein
VLYELNIFFSFSISYIFFALHNLYFAFQAQARFIDEFTVNQEAGRIWANVVVIAKGKACVYFFFNPKLSTKDKNSDPGWFKNK